MPLIFKGAKGEVENIKNKFWQKYMQLSATYFTGDNFSRNQHESWFEHSEGRGPNAGSRLHSLTDGSITEWCRPSLLVLGGAHAQLA